MPFLMVRFYKFTALAVIIFCLIVNGCAEREEAEVAPGSTAEADAQLTKAEQIMKDLGVSITLEDLAALNNLQELLPEPEKLSGKQAELAEAIGAFNQVLLNFGQPAAAPPALAPEKKPVKPSDSDLALVHFNLAYLYMLEAASVLISAKSEIYTVSFPKADKKGKLELYKFELTAKGKARFDELEKRILPRPRASDYIKVFTPAERQALIDSMVLLVGAKIRIKADPSSGIEEQAPKINKQIHLGHALYHVDRAIKFSIKISADVEEGLDKFDTTACKFLSSLLKNVEKWGFEVELSKEYLDRCKKKEAV